MCVYFCKCVKLVSLWSTKELTPFCLYTTNLFVFILNDTFIYYLYNCYIMMETETISITVDLEGLNYLKQKRISRSSFMRQAIKAHKEGKWNFSFL